MKFITFEKNQRQYLGTYNEKQQLVNLTVGGGGNPSLSSMLELIRSGEEGLQAAREVAAKSLVDASIIEDERNIKLLAPIPRPARNVYCIGLNYSAHTKEFLQKEAKLPEAMIVFSKSPNSVTGHESVVEAHAELTQEMDYEAELAVIIGRGGRDIPPEDVFDHIFGYSIINDITARDMQRKHQQWFLGKSLDTTCPMGPHIMHKSAILNPSNLQISSRVNGEVRQSSNTEHMIFDIKSIISTISRGHTLEAGDIVATGTCAGVGMGFNPPKFLKSGDVVEVEIEGIGVLRNTIQ